MNVVGSRIQARLVKYFLSSRIIYFKIVKNKNQFIPFPTLNRLKYSLPTLAVVAVSYYVINGKNSLIANCQSNRSEIEKCN